MHRLGDRDVRYLTEVDHHDHEALVACCEAEIVGVARYVRDRERLERAEVAVVVADDWNGRGLGRALLTELSARARVAGIETFTALVQAENQAALELLGRIGPTGRTTRRGEIELEIELPETGLGDRLADALRAAAGSLLTSSRGLLDRRP